MNNDDGFEITGVHLQLFSVEKDAMKISALTKAAKNKMAIQITFRVPKEYLVAEDHDGEEQI